MRTLAISIALFLACAATWAESDRATILADRIVYLRGGKELVATGNVEVFFQGYLLEASRLHYDSGVMKAGGPLTLSDGSGAVAVADYANLNDNLKTAILQGVEMLLDDHLQIAAANLEANDERYILLRNALVTACRTCAAEETPVWHFRSRSMVLDRQEQEVYLRDVDFMLGDSHLFTLPWLRLPEPSVKRKSGWLTPRLSYSSARGFTAGMPYYQTLGDHADITVAPYLNNRSSHYLEVEARRRYRRGWVDVTGSLASGSGVTSGFRGHAAAEGGWDLGAGFALSFSGTKVSDDGYFKEFGFSEEETFTNRVGVTRRSADTYFEYETSQIVRLIDAEAGKTLPRRVHEASWRARAAPPGIGGVAGLDLHALWLERQVSLRGRPLNVSRLSASVDWNRRWNTESGVVVTYAAAASADRYRTNLDTAALGGSTAELSGVTAIDFSLPLIKQGEGRRELLEPFLQFVWSPDAGGSAPPNEDSRYVEFDTTNLRSLNRFPGRDRRESGPRLNAGFKHTRSVDENYDLELTVGRVFRPKDRGEFTQASGLSGQASDYVASADLRLNSGIGLEQSLVADEKLDISKATSRLTYDSSEFGFDLGYTSIARDSAEGMTDDTQSVIAGVQLGLKDGWALASDVNLDLKKKAESNVGLGLEFNHQCLEFSAKVERTLRTANVPEAKNSLTVLFSLGGLSGAAQKSRSACAGG